MYLHKLNFTFSIAESYYWHTYTGQTSNGRWCLSASVVVVCNAAGGPVGRMSGQATDSPRRASTVTAC